MSQSPIHWPPRSTTSCTSAIARELLAVASAEGIRPESFNGFNPAAFLPGASDALAGRSLAEMVEFNRRSAKTHSGIWRDLAVRKRPTEIAMYEQVLAVGERHGQVMPLTRRMMSMIREIESGQRPLASANVDELAEELA